MKPFRLYRKIEKGEFFIVGGDCSQGGPDSNVAAFLSKNKLDFPIIYKKRGVAATMTPDLHLTLEWLFDITGIAPVIALERNNGGGSEMERLRVLNRLKHYRLYIMRKPGKVIGEEETDLLGYETNTATRPVLVGEYKEAFDSYLFKHYDKEIIEQHHSFIINSRGKPEKAKNRHDDGVIAPAVAWQLYQTEEPREIFNKYELPQFSKKGKWSIK
jgi:hypothetical protein